MNEVELEILAGGDVGDAVRVFFGEFGHDFQLGGVHGPKRNLDALHAGGVPQGRRAFGERVMGERKLAYLDAIVAVAVVVTLAVIAAAEAGFGEDALVDPTFAAQFDFGIKDIDFVREVRHDRHNHPLVYQQWVD